MINSSQNKFVRETRRVSDRRDRSEKFIVEGLKNAVEIADAQFKIHWILYSAAVTGKPEFNRLITGLNARKIPCFPVADRVLSGISDVETSQGLILVAEKPEWKTGEIFAGSDLLVLLDSIQDPGNLGTIIRTSEAAGVDAVLLTRGSVDPFNRKAVRATAGSILRLPVLQDQGNEEILRLKKSGFTVVAVHSRAEQAYNDFDYPPKIIFIFGSEGSGISDGIMKLADSSIGIPVKPGVDSLNVAVAAGIILFEAARRLTGKKIC